MKKIRVRKKRKLGPYQYKLRFPPIPTPLKIDKNLPHIVFYSGMWHIYRSKWKSKFRGPSPWWASCISAPTISELRQKMLKVHDGWKFGSNEIK